MKSLFSGKVKRGEVAVMAMLIVSKEETNPLVGLPE